MVYLSLFWFPLGMKKNRLTLARDGKDRGGVRCFVCELRIVVLLCIPEWL